MFDAQYTERKELCVSYTLVVDTPIHSKTEMSYAII